MKARADFAEISSGKRLGKYPQMTGPAAARTAKAERNFQVSPEAKAFIVNWLQEKYGVSLN